MRVENYSNLYFLDVVKLVENFHKEAVGEYVGLFDKNTLIEVIKNQDPKNAFLLIVDGVCQGIIFGIITQSLLSKQRMFQEMIWYVNAPFRKCGIALLRYAEKSLKESGVSIMIMAVLENSKTEKIKRFYERIGYKPIETHYMRKF